MSSNTLYTIVVDQTPISATFDAIAPNPRLTAVTNVNITFDKPMDITTVHASNVSLTLNGTNVSSPTLTMVSSNVYQIGGLAALTSAQGTYQLTVNYNGMRDDAGNAGTGSGSTTWTEVSSLKPVISQVGNVSLMATKKLKLTLSASDPSSLPIALSLGAGAPQGILLSNTTLLWTPSCEQGSSSNVITIWASETVSPYLSNSMSFAVIVGDCAELQVGSTLVLAGSNGIVPLTALATGNVTNIAFTLDFPTNRLVNWGIDASNGAIGSLVVQGLNTTQSVFTLSARSGQSLSGVPVLGSLSFSATAGSSAFIPLTMTGFGATEINNVSVATTFSTNGRVVLIGPEPLLETQTSGGSKGLILYGIPGNSYQIQSSVNLDSAANWSNFTRVPMTNLLATFSNLAAPAPAVFYRAYSFQASPPILDLVMSGQQPGLLAFGVKGTNYHLQTSTGIGAFAGWTNYVGYTLTNSFQMLTNIPNSKPALFYRIKTQ